MSVETVERKPPYIPFLSLKKFLAGFKSSGVPSRIDRSLLGKMSGNAQAQLRSALRFLGLTEGDDFKPTEAMKSLVSASGTEAWSGLFSELLWRAYEPILKGVDLDNDTHAQLEERFSKPGGVNGSARVKAIRFFLAALDDIGVTYSAHFKAKPTVAKSANGGGGGKKTARSRVSKPAEEEEDEEEEEDVPDGTRELLIALPTRDVKIWVPKDLDAEELEFVISQIQGYFRLAHRKTGKTT